MKKLMISIVFVLILICHISLSAAVRQIENFNTSQVSVMVFGTMHLSRHDFAEKPIAVEKIASSLCRFKPDMVVVEWLNPSLNPDDVPWYKTSYGDIATLARLWGYKVEKIDSTLTTAIATLKNLETLKLSTKEIRIEIGKLYYLHSDLVNAAYQWWIAGEEGADITELKRLTRNNFERSEINRYGFVIARNLGHEYLTSFDYHDWDAAWLGGKIWSEIRKKAVKIVDGVSEDDENWENIKKRFNKEYNLWSDKKDDVWIKKYGHIREVKEYVDHFVLNWDEAFKEWEQIDNSNGFGLMRFYQSGKYLDQQRKLYYDGMTKVTIKGLGKKNVENFEVRNKHMIDFMENDVKRLKAKKVLIIVGSGHKLFLENELQKRNYIIVPSYDFLSETKNDSK